MNDNDSERRGSHVTTDRDRVREWGTQRDAVPAVRESTDEGRGEYRLFRRGDVHEDYREHEWDEFLDRFESDNRAFVYDESETTGDDVGYHEFVDRDEAAARATVEDEGVEEELLSGGTVTTEVTETTVVEREIVETDTIESEVVDRDTLRSRVTDAELVEWEVSDPDVDFDVRADDDIAGATVTTGADGRARYDDLDLDTRVEGDITAEIDETWRLRREVDERATVESRVVDTDVEEHDRVEDDRVETSIDTAGVHRSIVEGGVIDADANADDVADRDLIESEHTGEGRIESRLVERKVYEDEIRRRKRIRFDYAGSDVIDTETLDSNLVESDVVEVDSDADETTAATDAGARGETTTGATADDEMRTELTDDDEGKTVVGEDGEEVGRIMRVEAGVAYVEPHAGFLERIEAMLGMGGHDDDNYPLESDQIRQITGDNVVVSDRTEDEIETDRSDRDDRDDRR